MVRDKLLRDKATTFAAYQIPHPLFPNAKIRVQTDGSIDPTEAMMKACRGLIGDLESVKQEFTKEMELKKIATMAENGEDGQNQGVNGQQNGQNGQYGYGYGEQGQYQGQGYQNGVQGHNQGQGYPSGASGHGYQYGYGNGQNSNGY